MKRLGLIAIVASEFFTLCPASFGARPHAQPIGEKPIELPLKEGSAVWVVAPSLSTAEVARKVMEEKRWSAMTSAIRISVVMAVVRSSLTDPLTDRFETVEKLRSAARQCPNQNGPIFHVYLYAYYLDDGSYMSVDHWSFMADPPKKKESP